MNGCFLSAVAQTSLALLTMSATVSSPPSWESKRSNRINLKQRTNEVKHTN